MENKKSGLLDGLILGGLIGVAIGLIFAPVTGDKTRQLIKDRLSELGLDGFVDRFSEALEAGKEEAAKVAKEIEM